MDLQFHNKNDHTVQIPFAVDGYRISKATGEAMPAYDSVDVPAGHSLFIDNRQIVIQDKSGAETQRISPNWRRCHFVADDQPLVDAMGPFLGYL